MPDPRGICPGCGESAEPHLTACLACGRDLTLTTTTQSTFEPAGAGNTPHFTDFRIVKTLGRGGMGTVYEAHQVSMRRRVALKVLSDQLSVTAVRPPQKLHSLTQPF